MANYCDFNIRLKAPNKDAARFIYMTQPVADSHPTIYFEEQKDDGYYLFYKGSCKWGIDNNCYRTSGLNVNLNNVSEYVDRLDEETLNCYLEVPMDQKSKTFKTDIDVLSWSSESGFIDFYHLVNGKKKKGKYQPKMGMTLLNEKGKKYLNEFDEPFECEEDVFMYDEESYDSFEEFLEDEELPEVLNLKEHFHKIDDNLWGINQFGVNYCEEPDCEWNIK